MTPILPPNEQQAVAWLKQGDRLSDGRTVTAAGEGERLGRTQLWVQLDRRENYAETRDGMDGDIRELAPYVVRPPDPPLSPDALRLAELASSFGFSYYPKQLAYIDRVAQAPGCLIAAETGCGKSCMAISLIQYHRPKRCLVIAPQGVITAKGDAVSQWEAEFARFAPNLKPRRVSAFDASDGVHLTYMQEALANDGGGWLRHVPPDFYDMIIADESHILQHHRTVMGQALYQTQPRWRYALTATPVCNRVDECYMLIRWLRPDLPVGLPQYQLRPRPYSDGYPLATYKSLAHVVAAIRKSDIRPDLPPLHIHKVYSRLEPELMAKYRDLDANFTMKKGDAGTLERVKLNKLRNLCAESSVKAELIAAQALLKPCVVASARIRQTDLIARHLYTSFARRRIGRIDSTQPSAGVPATSAAFQRGDLDILLMGIKVAYGHSFPGCDTIHVASLEWSYGAFAQAVGRVWRVNSQRPVHAYVYLLRDTIEERMFDTICSKESAAMTALYGENP